MQLEALRQLINLRLLKEVSSQWVEEVAEAVEEEELSFGHLFGDKLRMVIPFQGGALLRIKKMIEEADPTATVNVEDGTVTKTIETRRGSRQRTERLGRVLQKNTRSMAKQVEAELKKFGITKDMLNDKGLKQPPNTGNKALDGYITALNDRYDMSSDNALYFFVYGLAMSPTEPGVMRGVRLPGNTDRTFDKWMRSEGGGKFGEPPKKMHKLAALSSVYVKLVQAQQTYAEEAGGASIVISRAPIDVLRMSDFKNIQSCHSEGGSYFHCAVAEAKASGLIAYLVKNEDLEKVKDRLEDDEEIFADKDRGVDGITPIARIRIRQFRNSYGFDLAVPEVRTYGNDREGFLETLTQWSLASQMDELGEALGGRIYRDEDNGSLWLERPNGKNAPVEDFLEYSLNMNDFVLMGGSYSDNPSSTLFNNMFNTRRYHGDVEYGGDEEGSRADQIREEAEGYYDNYSLSSVDMNWDSDEEGVSWDWDYNETYYLAGERSIDEDMESEIESVVDDAIYSMSSMTITISVSINDDEIEIDLSASDSGYGHPDDFDTALQELEQFNEETYEFEQAVYDAIESLGDSIYVDEAEEEDEEDEEEDDEEEEDEDEKEAV